MQVISPKHLTPRLGPPVAHAKSIVSEGASQGTPIVTASGTKRQPSQVSITGLEPHQEIRHVLCPETTLQRNQNTALFTSFDALPVQPFTPPGATGSRSTLTRSKEVIVFSRTPNQRAEDCTVHQDLVQARYAFSQSLRLSVDSLLLQHIFVYSSPSI